MKRILMFFFALSFLIFAPIMGASAEVYDGNSLDTGIYWFGKGDVSEKFIDGQNNSYFDPSKPTMIYVHGWQNGKTETLYRETFNPNNDLNVNLADFWIDKGWNVGIFYWNQLADELEVKDAEAKIWTVDGPRGMRWRKPDNSYVTSDVPSVSVSELFVQAYIEAMKDYSGSEIRLCGHSLGNQVVINVSKLISDRIDNGSISPKLLPNRVTLLDPFYSKGEKDYLNNKWTGELCREYVTSLKEKNVVFELYKSSNINDLMVGDSNDGMKKLTAFIDVYPDYTGFFDQSAKHSASKELYFYSMAFNPPAEIKDGVATGKDAGYASTSTDRIREMMNMPNKWTQRDGKNTNTPEDDTFDIVDK